MIILDTDHISELQQPNSARGARLAVRLAAARDRTATTVVTVEEQARGWLASINKEAAGIDQVDSYTNLMGLIQFFQKWLVLPFDRLTAEEFHRLRSQRIRISTS